MTEKVRIVTKAGGWTDFDKLAGFDMALFVQSIRSQGYFMMPNVYIPADWIGSIFTWGDGAEPAMVVMPNAPGSETKQ